METVRVFAQKLVKRLQDFVDIGCLRFRCFFHRSDIMISTKCREEVC